MLESVSIVWVNLDTEPVVGIQNLSQKWKYRFWTITKQFTVLCIQSSKICSLVATIGNFRNTIWMG